MRTTASAINGRTNGVRVDNYGVIRTTNGGQAIDFDAIASGPAIVINNYAGAELRSFGQDAVRPGQGAIVTNAGLIYADGATGNSYDGIDWQARTGTISGRWDGVAANGDGDGVDIDFIGTVVNSGTIAGVSAAGVDSGGRLNSAEGIALGEGSIVNNAGASIFGAGNGILVNHDTNPGGVVDGATTITNAGTIRGGTGTTITFVGNFADTITNSGIITAGSGRAIDLGNGNDTLNLGRR